MGAPVMQPARHTAAPALRNDARAHASVLMVLTLVRMVHHPASPEACPRPAAVPPKSKSVAGSGVGSPAHFRLPAGHGWGRLAHGPAARRGPSFAMGQRYAHLAPDHTRPAVQR